VSEVGRKLSGQGQENVWIWDMEWIMDCGDKNLTTIQYGLLNDYMGHVA
jgi:hypothetical protein